MSDLLFVFPLIADVRERERQVGKVPQAEMRCRPYFIASTFLDFRLLLKLGERTKHEEHDLTCLCGPVDRTRKTGNLGQSSVATT